MKGKILAGLLLTGVICFSASAFAAKLPNVPVKPGDKPSLPQSSLRDKLPSANSGDTKLPSVPPNLNAKPSLPNALDGKAPADLKPNMPNLPQKPNMPQLPNK